MALVTTLPTLDECGHIYIAGAGENGACLRLNQAGSRLWREHVGPWDLVLETVRPVGRACAMFKPAADGNGDARALVVRDDEARALAWLVGAPDADYWRIRPIEPSGDFLTRLTAAGLIK